MRVKMPLGMSLAVGGTLVKSHGVGKRSCEQIVVARRDAMQDVRQRVAARFRKLLQRTGVPLADHDRFKRPHRPERHDRCELIILADDPVLLFVFRFSSTRKANKLECACWYATNDACSLAGSFGSVAFAQIWPCGCGLLAPIMAPRFSKMRTELMPLSLPSN